MSLNSHQIGQNALELQANLELSGLSSSEVAAALEFTPNQLEEALSSSGNPVDVWQLRDYLEAAVRSTGREPVPFTILTESARASARGWFDLREPPTVTRYD